MRKRLWQFHSWLGLLAGLGLTLIGLTGSVLVFHREIARNLHPEIVLRESAPDAPRLPLAGMITAIEQEHPDYWVRGWLLYHGEPVRDHVFLTPHADVHDWHVLHVDPATGQSAGGLIARRDTLYGWFVELHYTFFADHTGMVLTAFLALIFIFLSLSGLYLHRAFFQTLFRLRWKQSWRIVSSDLHKAIGIASLPFNLLLGITGAYWNIAHMVSEWGEDHDAPDAWHSYEGRLEQLDEIPTLAEETWPGFSLNYLYLPTAEDRRFYVFGRTPESSPLRSRYGSRLWFDAENLETLYTRDLRTAGFGARLLDAFEPLHFGDFGGLGSKVLWCLAGLAPGALLISGALIWWHRQRPRPATSPSP